MVGTTTRISDSNNPGAFAAGDSVILAAAASDLVAVDNGFTTQTEQMLLRDIRFAVPQSTPGTLDGDDFFGGLEGNLTLDLGAGDDILFAGRGRQTLQGGSGKDRFVFRLLDQRPDRIVDFELKQDRIDLSTVLDRFTPQQYRGNPIADQYVRFFPRGSNTLISIDRNGKRQGGLQPLVVVEGVTVAQLSNRSNFLF